MYRNYHTSCHCPDYKAANNPVVNQSSFQIILISFRNIFTQALRPAPQVTDAHGCRNAVIVDFAKAFHLNATGQRCHAVGHEIHASGHKADCYHLSQKGMYLIYLLSLSIPEILPPPLHWIP